MQHTGTFCRPCVIISETDISTGEQLGTGGFSVVYSGTWLGTPVAIKKWLNSGTSDSERSEMRGEIMSNAVSCLLLQPLCVSVFPVVMQLQRCLHTCCCGPSWPWSSLRTCSLKCSHPYPSVCVLDAYICLFHADWLMQGLRHPNIVTFCGACTEGPSAFMVTELMPFSLLQILYEMPSISLPVPKVLNMARDICHAFVYLHSRRPRVIHRYVCTQHWMSKHTTDLPMNMSTICAPSPATFIYLDE